MFVNEYGLRSSSLPKMSNTPAPNIYESTFAPSDKTDAILAVEGKKLHVNKSLLSYHSDYFKALFNSNFAEKSMPEIPIKDVKLEDFATLLSLVQDNPILPKDWDLVGLLELADRFLLPAAKRHVEILMCSSDYINRFRKLELAEKYNLDVLFEKTLKLYKDKEDCKEFSKLNVSQNTKAKLFDFFFKKFYNNL